MKERTEQELEQLTQRLMATGSKVCPDCGASTLSVTFDANYLKIRCGSCDFRFEDYYGG
jgi:transcription elongation factor Elf1